MIQILCGTVKVNDTKDFLKKLQELSGKYDLTIQAIDADLIAGTRHLTFAAEKAIQSFVRKTNISNNLAMETLLYIAGTRQIEKALKFGIKTGHNNIALLIINQNSTTNPEQELTQLISENASVIDYSEDKKEQLMKLFNITPGEINAAGEEKIPLLVLERVALTNLIK